MAQLTPNIIVNDVNKTVKFYETIGFSLTMGVDTEKQSSLDTNNTTLIWALISLNGADLMIQHVDSILDELPDFTMSTGSNLTLYLKIENVIEYFRKINDKVEVIKTPYTTFYGAEEFVIRDLNGFILYFAEMPNE